MKENKKVETFIPKGFKVVKIPSRKQQYGYVLLNKKNGMPLLSSRLPIYWLKRVAVQESKKWNCTVKKVWLLDWETISSLNTRITND